MTPQQPHDYRQPPPGTASSRDMVCSKCGAKRSVAGMTECPGVHRESVIETVHDSRLLNPRRADSSLAGGPNHTGGLQ